MTELLYNRVSVLVGGFGIMTALAVCMMYCQKRQRFWLRLSLSLVCYAAIACVFAFAPTSVAVMRYTNIAYIIVAAAAAVAAMYACFDKPLYHAVFCGNIALAVRLFSAKSVGIAEELMVENDAITARSPYMLLLHIGVFAAFCALFCFLMFARPYKGKSEEYVNRDVAVLCPVFLAVSTVLSALELLLDGLDAVYVAVFYICEAMYGFIMLLINYAILKQGQSDFELSVVKQLWNEDRKHYEVQKETVEIINVKCHDLRHQIRALASNNGLSEQALREIESSVNIYDSIVKTGNEVLDVILSDFSLRCKNSNVVLTCMVDGEKIKLLDEMDVYSLFGNLLENALEYETSDIDEESRFISLTVKSNKGYLSIHCENYFVGVAEFKNSVLVTRKADKDNHGFGMKSMKTIAEKYDGSFNAKVVDDMFQVDVLIPITADETSEASA